MQRPTLLEILPPLCFGLGTFTVSVNLFTSFLQYPIHRLFGGTNEDYRHTSGLPLIGSPLLLIAAIAYSRNPPMAWLAIALAILDTGGIHFALLSEHLVSKRRRRIILVLMIAVAAVAGTYAWWCHWRNNIVPLPETDEIVEMNVELEGMDRVISGKDENEKLTFVVPRKHWGSILDSLRPYHRARVYEKGYVPGEIRIKLQNGNEFTIVILLLSGDEVFFWIGPERNAHAGGDKRKLYRALKDAAKADESKRRDNRGG